MPPRKAMTVPRCPTPGTVGHLGQRGTLVPVGQPPPVGQGQYFSLFSLFSLAKNEKMRISLFLRHENENSWT